MKKKIVPEIRDKYEIYTALLKGDKSILEKEIAVDQQKINNKHFIQSINISITHPTIFDDIHFVAEVKKMDYHFFKLRLRAKNIFERPFFRYDSDGDTHRNFDDKLPLEEQEVLTPHFHFFNEEGVEWAYQTPALKNDASREVLKDISLCMAHFCQEGKVYLDGESYPEIIIMPNHLPIPIYKPDPNSGVTFP